MEVWRNLFIGGVLFLSILGVSKTSPGLFDAIKEDIILGRYQVVRTEGVQGGMFVVDTSSGKVKFCAVTPVNCSPWKN